jgi:hypothetical protein
MKHTNPTTTKYPEMYDYYVDNEYDDPRNDPHGYLKSIKEDTRNDELLGEIENHLNEEDILKDLSTGLIKDMFSYYIKHSK